jgi:hypothetical protein
MFTPSFMNDLLLIYDLAPSFPFSLTCFNLNLFAEVREEESLNLTAAIWFAWGVLLNSGIGNCCVISTEKRRDGEKNVVFV